MKINTMKYIRTKDGRIIELPKTPTLMKYDNTIIDLNAIRKGKVGHEIINALIDNQADTIEELCDGYVIEHPLNAFKFFYDKEEMFNYLNGTCLRMFDIHELKIYACILTSKGLIYVAKMNDKGELELL